MDNQSGSTRFRAHFEFAIQAYEKKTGITFVEHPLVMRLQNCHSIESMTALVQDQASAFSEFRGKDRIMKLVKSTLSLLTNLSAAASLGNAVGLPFPLANTMHAGLAILLATAKGVSASYDALVDLLESIEHFLRRLEIYTQIPHTPALDEMVVKIMVELLSTLAFVTKELKQGRLTKFSKKLFGDNDVETVLARLDRLTQDEARTTAAEILKVVHGLVQNMNNVMGDGKPYVDSVNQALEILHKMTSDKNKSKRDKLRKDIRNWLSPPDPWKNHHMARESHHEGTATWFIRGNMFLEWKASIQSSLIWVHGKPGAGKTVLCSTIIKEIEAVQKSGLASIAFYYYDFRDDQKMDLRGLLSSVLLQLCDQSNSYHDILSTFYSTHRDGTQSPNDDELAKCLKELLKLPGQAPVYLIVDALDECPNTSALSSPRKKVLKHLKYLIDSQLPNLRICITSRPEADIKAVLQPLSSRSVSIHEESGQMKDIENYIKWTVNTHIKMRYWKDEDKQLVIDVLTKRADGMFRWAYCQLDYLGDCHPGRILHALDDLPETLDGTYERTLREIKNTNWEFARRLFLCVAVASRPLCAEELAEFLAFDFEAGPIPKFREDWRQKDPLEVVLSTCSTLLALVNVHGSKVIQFSHSSVKEFLTSTRFADKRDIISSRYHISMTPAHTLIAKACLGILLHLDDNITEDSLRRFPLAEYAAEHWFEHARFEDVSQYVEEGMKQLFDASKPHLAIWVWIRDPMTSTEYRRAEGPLPPLGSPLHYAAFCGLHSVVKSLAIERPQDVHSRGFDDKLTPLHMASEMGHVEVARLLVEHGAEKTAQDKHGSTPLHLAVRGGGEDLARILIDHGADVTVKNNDGSTPLHLAAEEGTEDLARLLIDHGANVKAKDNNKLTPLHLAVQEENVDLISLLVEHGADVTAKDNDGSTLLHWAVQEENINLVRLFVEHGGDVTAKDKDKLTPLHLAAQEGSEDLARLFIEHGADVKAKDNDRLTPLHFAVQKENVDLIRLLVKHGADVTAKDKDGSTLLHFATQEENLDLARLLVQHGADVTAKDKGRSTPLHLAVQQESVDIAYLLVENGADAKAKDKDWSTPLHLAVRQRNVDLAYLLIEHGADVKAKDNGRSTPLHWAVQQRSVDLACLLVERGADVNAKDAEGSSPLHLAVQERSEDLARLLIENGADAKAKNNDGLTPLHLAVREGREDLVLLLIESGADVKAKDNDRSTPLRFAVQKKNVDLICLLIEHGAEMTAKDDDGSTLLYLAVQEGREDLARLLVEHGADVRAKNSEGSTPLHLAVQEGREDLARLLVEHGADVKAKNKDRFTPLHLAVQKRSEDLARFLIEHGADVKAKNDNGSTPLHLAVEEGGEDLSRLLLEHGADLAAKDKDRSTPLHLAVEEGSEDLVRLLIEHGADVNAKDKDRSTPLHLAMDESVDIIYLLIEHGADTTAKNDDGSTLLHAAVEGNSVELARLLVKHGVDVKAKNNDGSTPLHLAVKEENMDLARLLIDHGADLKATDNDGLTPLRLALKRESTGLARLLIEHCVDGSISWYSAVGGGEERTARLFVEHGAHYSRKRLHRIRYRYSKLRMSISRLMKPKLWFRSDSYSS